MTKKAALTQARKGTEASEVKALIAIVDDDESVRVALAGLFRSMGLATEAFASAIEFLNSQHLSQTTCLILDVMMPGMNGIELQHQLALRDHPIPIIFITGHRDESIRARALRGGAVSFLPKPFSEEALLTAVQSVMAEGQR